MEFTINLKTKLLDLKNQHAIYRVLDSTMTEVLFIGYCPLTQIFQMTEPSRHPLFKHNEQYYQQVLNICPDKISAMMLNREYLRNCGPMPRFNKYASRGKIICDQTGEHFESVHDAARVHNIDPTALSKHLNRTPGFKSVKKRTYFYLTK